MGNAYAVSLGTTSRSASNRRNGEHAFPDNSHTSLVGPCCGRITAIARVSSGVRKRTGKPYLSSWPWRADFVTGEADERVDSGIMMT